MNTALLCTMMIVIGYSSYALIVIRSTATLSLIHISFRRLGIEEGKDQVKGIEFLKSLPYIDGNRIGVHGWSFGGHMTTALLLRYPEKMCIRDRYMTVQNPVRPAKIHLVFLSVQDSDGDI